MQNVYCDKNYAGSVCGLCAVVRVTDIPETRESYPFAFFVTIRYVLKDGELLFEQTYENTGKGTSFMGVDFPYDDDKIMRFYKGVQKSSALYG